MGTGWQLEVVADLADLSLMEEFDRTVGLVAESHSAGTWLEGTIQRDAEFEFGSEAEARAAGDRMVALLTEAGFTNAAYEAYETDPD